MRILAAPKILGVGTAVPPYALGQNEIKEFAAGLFREGFNNLERMLPVFENGCIETRYLSQPLSWYGGNHSFAEANHIFAEVALALAELAAQRAIDRAGIKPEDIGMVLFVSSTGITTPTLDAKLIQNLGLSAHAGRLPIWGLGCGGGVGGLARAAEIARCRAESAVLVVAVELCSLTFQRNDLSKSNLVGASIFSDGAAAAVIAMQGEGPSILGSYSTLFPQSEDVMGWDLVDTGLKVRFSRDIPSIVHRFLPGLLAEACARWQVEQGEIRHFVAHPGGAKVLQAYTDSLGLGPGQLEQAYDVLTNYGNMSSCSVLFVLEKFLQTTPPSQDYGLMLSLGPGFSAEQVLFQW